MVLNLFSGAIRGNCVCFQHTRFEKVFYFGLSLPSPRNCHGKTKMTLVWLLSLTSTSSRVTESNSVANASFLTTLRMTLFWYWGLPFLINPDHSVITA